MSLITVLLTIIVVGFLLWLVNTLIPMSRPIKQILNIVVIVILVIWLLKVFGLFTYLTSVHV